MFHKLIELGMAFSNGKVVKECIVSAVTKMSESIPEKYSSVLSNAVKSVSLSSGTVVDFIASQTKHKTLLKYLNVITFLLMFMNLQTLRMLRK